MDLFFSGNQSAADRSPIRIVFFSAFFLFILLSVPFAKAQTTILNDYNPTVTDTILDQGGVEFLGITVQVSWSPDQEFESAEIDLEMSNIADLTAVSMWTAEAIDPTPGNSLTATVDETAPGELRISISRLPGQTVQEGLNLVINLGIPADSFTGDVEVARVGGIIIWENVAFKTTPPTPSPASSLQVWPQPAGQFLHLDLEGHDEGHIRLYDLQGRLAYDSGTPRAFPATLPLDQLNRGSYVLQLELHGAAPITRRIIKR